MKKIECVIRPEKLLLVEQALRNEHVGGMTISEVKGFGLQRKEARSKIKLEIYAMEVEVERILRAIRLAAFTGDIGDGKIAVLPLDNVIRVRTQEQGAKALV